MIITVLTIILWSVDDIKNFIIMGIDHGITVILPNPIIQNKFNTDFSVVNT